MPTETPVAQLIAILTASIAPVIVISGVGLLLLSMTNRYGRVIDRARDLAKQLEAVGEGPRRNVILEEVEIIYRRARIVRLAIILGAVSIGFVALTVFAIFAAQVLRVRLDYIAVPCFGLCLVSLLGALYFFIRDVTISLGALELELGSYRKR